MIVSHNARGHRQRAGSTAYKHALIGLSLAPVDPNDRIVRLKQHGMSVRQIAYLTGIPRSTVNDHIQRSRPATVQPMPFWMHVNF